MSYRQIYTQRTHQKQYESLLSTNSTSLMVNYIINLPETARLGSGKTTIIWISIDERSTLNEPCN